MVEKVVLVILDGLSDRPIQALGGKTPLEAAKRPNLNTLARRGMTGLMHPVDIGIRPGSDVAHLSLFGYDPNVYYTGRGPFEAIGVGMKLKAGDVAFRGNFATVDLNWVVVNRRAGRIEDTKPLIEAVEKGISGTKGIRRVEFQVKKGTGHRLAVVARGKNLSGKLTDSDPHKEGAKVWQVKPLDSSKESARTAWVVNTFIKRSYQILSPHPVNKERETRGLPPANIILLRGAGQMGEFPSFRQRYGLSAVCIAGASMYKGLALTLGMQLVEVAGATGKPDTNLTNKVTAAIRQLSNHDFVFLHIKASDSLAEDGDWQAKKAFIEKVDKEFFPLLKLPQTLIVVTADHTTSSTLRRHTADPVPILMVGEGIRTDQVKHFGERAVVSGKLGHIQGRHLMPIILDQIGRSAIFGA